MGQAERTLVSHQGRATQRDLAALQKHQSDLKVSMSSFIFCIPSTDIYKGLLVPGAVLSVSNLMVNIPARMLTLQSSEREYYR